MKSVIVLFAVMLVAVLSVEADHYEIPLVPIPQYRVARSADLEAGRVQRQAGGEHQHDVTDFGAHTGHHGAYGWYADFPVIVHHSE